MAFEPVINVWPGSSSFTTGSTPYGYYDSDTAFRSDIDKFANWAAKRLGYPVTNIELIDVNFYAVFEDAVSKYGTLVSSFNARDNLINVSGLPTSSVRLESQYVTPTAAGVFKLAKQYATEVGVGGTLTYYTGSIALTEGQQVYNFKDTGSVTIEEGDFNSDVFTIRKIFHNAFPGATVDPSYVYGDYDILSDFGWRNTSPVAPSILMPLNYDMMRVQAIELSDQIRGASYSFQMTGDRIWIFPVPTEAITLHFQYTLDSEVLDPNTDGSNDGKISDISNIPYFNLTYSTINDLGKDWIKRFALANATGTLGLIRGKYSALPFGDTEITLNSADLISQAQTDQENLLTELNELLDSTSRQAQLERKQAEADALQTQLMKVPLPIYVR